MEVGPVIVSALILDQFTGYTRVHTRTLPLLSTILSDATLRLERNRPREHTYIQRYIMYSHVQAPARNRTYTNDSTKP